MGFWSKEVLKSKFVDKVFIAIVLKTVLLHYVRFGRVITWALFVRMDVSCQLIFGRNSKKSNYDVCLELVERSGG
jgi:hypothetical protein